MLYYLLLLLIGKEGKDYFASVVDADWCVEYNTPIKRKRKGKIK